MMSGNAGFTRAPRAQLAACGHVHLGPPSPTEPGLHPVAASRRRSLHQNWCGEHVYPLPNGEPGEGVCDCTRVGKGDPCQ